MMGYNEIIISIPYNITCSATRLTGTRKIQRDAFILVKQKKKIKNLKLRHFNIFGEIAIHRWKKINICPNVVQVFVLKRARGRLYRCGEQSTTYYIIITRKYVFVVVGRLQSYSEQSTRRYNLRAQY